jgi:hypothetical protein
MRLTTASLMLLALFFSGCLKQEACQPMMPAPAPEVVKADVPKECECAVAEPEKCDCTLLNKEKPLRIIVVGQGVAPCADTCSPEQALVLAKRAAIIDGYRLIAEKVKGVYVQGNDYVHNMMIKSSKVRTYVDANVRNANVLDTLYKDGLCEVEMEIVLNHSQLAY